MWKRQNYRDSKKIVAARDREEREREMNRKHTEDFLEGGSYYTLYYNGGSGHCAIVKTHRRHNTENEP